MESQLVFRQAIQNAAEQKKAIGHFNVSNLEMIHGVVAAAINQGEPVIIGLSEGERDFVGIREAVALVSALRRQYKHPIFLNADHTYSFERVKEAIELGFDQVIFDGTELSFEENVIQAKKCVDYAREYTNRTSRYVVIEVELGFIGKSSKILDKIPDGAQISEEMLTTPEDAKKFIELTGADLLAPAVGNIHGMLKGGVDPALNLKRIADIRNAVGVPLVLHGGSGNSADDFRGAVAGGCAIVHVSTELRVAYKNALVSSISASPDELTPYKYLRPTIKAVQAVVEEKIKILANK